MSDTRPPEPSAADALSAIYELIHLAESGHFYENYDVSWEVLGRAKEGWEALRQITRTLP